MFVDLFQDYVYVDLFQDHVYVDSFRIMCMWTSSFSGSVFVLRPCLTVAHVIERAEMGVVPSATRPV